MGYEHHSTKTGRTVIVTDGRSPTGALMQGAIISRFSVPLGVTPEDAIATLRGRNCHRCKNAGPNYIESIRDAVPGIRVFEWSMVR